MSDSVSRAALPGKACTEKIHEGISMADDLAQINPEHSNWLSNALLAEDRPAPSPVIFASDPKCHQAALVRVIGERMRQARELCNLSQSVAAKRLGYQNPSKLSKVELATDTNSVPLWLIVRAASVYEVSVDFLVGTADDCEVGAPRGAQDWMLHLWEAARQRDMDAVVRVRKEIVAVREHTTALVDGVFEVAEALDRLRARNPEFDDMSASGTLAGRLERIQARALAARAALKRFHQSAHREQA